MVCLFVDRVICVATKLNIRGVHKNNIWGGKKKRPHDVLVTTNKQLYYLMIKPPIQKSYWLNVGNIVPP